MISAFLTRPIPKPAKAVKSDPQRSRFYKMEREFVGSSIYHKVSRDDLESIMRHACAYYKIRAPKLVVYNDKDDRRFGESVSYSIDGGPDFGHTLRLNRGFHGANVVTLMHELAHYIVDATYENHHGHGKKFCGVYMHLLDKYRVLPAVAFRALAKKWRIEIAGKFKPAAIRG